MSDIAVPYRVARDMIVESLEGSAFAPGRYLADGIVVSSFLPVRPSPFRVVFLLGLGERSFPRADLISPFDIRWSEIRPHRGDVISNRVEDEYLFLETLTATRDRLYLSYIAWDQVSGERLDPSPIVGQFKWMLSGQYVSEESLAQSIRHIDHRGHSSVVERPDRIVSPNLRKEATCLDLRRSLEDFCRQSALPIPELQELREHLTADRWRSLSAELGLFEPSFGPKTKSVKPLVVTLSQLRHFLQTPLQRSHTFHIK